MAIKIRCDVPPGDDDFGRLFHGMWVDVVGLKHRRRDVAAFIHWCWDAQDREMPFGARARREPHNRHDPNAIAVDGWVQFGRGKPKEVHLGYLPADLARDLAGRDIRVELVNLYLGDEGFLDVEVVVFGPPALEEVLADFDSAAVRTWLREICMPGLKVLAHLSAADGGTSDDERAVMTRFARAVAIEAQATIEPDMIDRAVADALSMAPSARVVQTALGKLKANDAAMASLLQSAAELARLDGVTDGERAVLQRLLQREGVAVKSP